MIGIRVYETIFITVREREVLSKNGAYLKCLLIIDSKNEGC